MKTRRLFPAILASALLISPAFALDQSPLPAGKPAGVRQADLSSPLLIGLSFLVVIGLGVGLVVNNEGNQTSSSTGTSP